MAKEDSYTLIIVYNMYKCLYEIEGVRKRSLNAWLKASCIDLGLAKGGVAHQIKAWEAHLRLREFY